MSDVYPGTTAKPGSSVNYWNQTDEDSGGCSQHRIDLNPAADPEECNVDGAAQNRRFPTYKTPNRGTASTVSSGSIISSGDYANLKSRFDAELSNWGASASIPNVGSGTVVLASHYNSFVTALNSIKSSAGNIQYWNYFVSNLGGIPGTKSSGQVITAADWNALVTKINQVSGQCVANKSCECNAVCASYQNCRCNGYNSTGCTWVTNESGF